MPNSLTVGDYLRVRTWTRVSNLGQAAVNTVHYFVSSVGGSPATDLDAATFIDGVIAPQYKVLLSALAEYRGTQAQILKATAPYAARFAEAEVNSNAGVGLGSSDLLPAQSCGLGSFQTPVAGQANRGRLYVSFPARGADDTTGKPTSGYVGSLATLIALYWQPWTIVAGGRTATLLSVIMHRTNKAGTIPVPTAISSASVSTLWATQRRRGGFGRGNTSPI